MAGKIYESVKSGMPISGSGAIQKAHYNRTILEYERHYGDEYSQHYRERFIYPRLFGDINFQGKNVLEAMCGTGEITGYLATQGARVTGIDVSDSAIDIYKRKWPGCETRCASVVDSGLPSGSFDVVVVSFGLHHVHPDTDKVILEFHRVLKKGGLLCFAEPHRDSLLDKARRFWYKCDKLFAKNERAIDLSGLKERFGPYFQFQGEHYGGSAAYLLVLNSMIFRIPQGIKKYYTRSMFILESMIGKMQGSFLSGFVICQWRKI